MADGSVYDEPRVAKPVEEEKGSIGFIVLTLILMFGAVALAIGIAVYWQAFNACAYSQITYCPVYVCPDGSNPLLANQEATDAYLKANNLGFVVALNPDLAVPTLE